MQDPDVIGPVGTGAEIEVSQNALAQKLGSGRNKKYVRFAVAALSAIPWIGGVIGASASFSAEHDQEQVNDLHRLWLQEHQSRVLQLGETLNDIFERLESFGDEIQERVESPGFLALVKQCFREWDEAETDDKREMLKKLITNAAAITLCPDDLIRLFLNWIELYHEAHFAVIKEIYRHPGVTRGQIWDTINRVRPREDSAEADLYRFLIRDLSTGGVIRQQRETDGSGQFLKKDRPHVARGMGAKVMTSAWDEIDPYELTKLGKQFVHYVMEDVAPQLGG
ncbi:conserved hypothetical protein [Candidatus Koribacter versatilis Ellin345]|uniref:Uncharacterized protein n=1 Tax=Koribacter versatilis (strain Ellin345) TaxID=204669 RepID=Q1ISL0_KORVE|nr:hypothetical protein [Candidatus Koribacter versatilis]ABF40140.1 conserved hypothetical protein [Candidatus Koribacter versatilis Ellin345]